MKIRRSDTAVERELKTHTSPGVSTSKTLLQSPPSRKSSTLLSAIELVPLNFNRAKPSGLEALPNKLQQQPLSSFTNTAAASTAEPISTDKPHMLMNRDLGRAVARIEPSISEGPGVTQSKICYYQQ
jgi:hypothetical protein